MKKNILLLFLLAIVLGGNVCKSQTPILFPLQYVDSSANFFDSYKNEKGEVVSEVVYAGSPAYSSAYLITRDSIGGLTVIDSTSFGKPLITESGIVATVWNKKCRLKFSNGQEVELPGVYMDHSYIYTDRNLNSLTDVSGGVIVSSMEYLTSSSHTTYLRKYDTLGNLLWETYFFGRLRSLVSIDSISAVILDNEDYGVINVLSLDLSDGTITSTTLPGQLAGAWTAKLLSNGKVGFVAHDYSRSSFIQFDPVTMQIDTNFVQGIFFVKALDEINGLVLATGYSVGVSGGVNLFAFDLLNGGLISYLVNTGSILPEQSTDIGDNYLLAMRFLNASVYLSEYNLPSIAAGIHYVPQLSNISVYPTSTTDSWTINGNKEEWQLINTLGEIVRVGSGSGRIDATNLSSGSYTFVFLNNRTQKVQRL